MSGSAQNLAIHEERCDRCGACPAACPRGALKVGAAFIYVDRLSCDGCLACVQVCTRGAILGRVVPTRSSAEQTNVPLSEVTHVVVGSRAEAKAVRKAAERAAKEQKRAAAPKKLPPSKGGAQPQAPVAAPVPAPRPRTTKAQSAGTEVARQAAHERPAPTAVRAPVATAWTLVDAGAVLAVMLVSLVAKNAVLALPAVGLMPALGQMAVRAVVLAAYYVIQIAAFGWLAGRHGLPVGEAFGLARPGSAPSQSAAVDRPSTIVSALLVVAVFIGCEIVSIGYGLSMEAMGIARPERLSGDLAGVFGAGPIGLALAVVLVAIAAPLAEEMAFRGVILPAFGERFGMWAGIGVSAVLYAGFHADLWLFAPTAVLGVALGWLTWTRRSLWPAFIVHVLYNTAAVAAAFATVR
ncbi:MAG: CPBP family intramembrane metalloprotease [Coriobacteriia bacterium]|nr:CPBP family intramembrane metalloprotease [Coriobacteriia bacterium]